MSHERKSEEKKRKGNWIFDKSVRKGINVTLPPLYVESPLKLILQVPGLVSQVVFPIHRFRVVEGCVNKSVDVLHESSLHFPFTLVLRLRRRDGSGFLALVTSSTIFPSWKLRVWAVGRGGRCVD